MKIIPMLAWAVATEPPEPLDARLLPLLEAVDRGRSLAAAVEACAISYRAGWGLLRDYEAKLRVPLVVLERGRGARLAAAGEAILAAHRAGARRLARALPALAIDIGAAKGPAGVAARRPQRVSIAASHDLALSALRDASPEAAGVVLDISVLGSLHALAELEAGRVEVAGFHVPIGAPGRMLAPFRTLLHPRRDRLIRFVERDQGFILPRGNPARVHGFRDLARRRLRFVNRQRGSGTRVLIDSRLAAEGVQPSGLAGYRNEEFTHRAVAATVASGAADAGFGLRAAAAEYGLAFVPAARERYYLATRASALSAPAVARLVEMLRGPAFARMIRALPGYRCVAAGSVVSVEALEGGRRGEMR
jgi:putative molybdopterin biosynthesis protein